VVSLQPTATVVADLGHFAYRLDLGVTTVRDVPAFSLVYRYPPLTTALMRPDGQVVPLASMALIALARVPITVAESPDALQRVVEVSLDGGTLDKDIARMTEAYQLFRNSPRTRVETLEGCVKDSAEVLKAYWGVREWLAEGAGEKRAIALPTDPPTQLVLLP
jgi:hypothetical protein